MPVLYAGTWLYWLMGGGFTKPPRYLTRRTIRREEPAIRADDLLGGFEYSDAHLHDNDARFTFFFVRSALDRGCIAANYVESGGAEAGEPAQRGRSPLERGMCTRLATGDGGDGTPGLALPTGLFPTPLERIATLDAPLL